MMRLLANGKTFLQAFREDRDMTRKQLAHRAGCSPRTIEAWEQKKADLGNGSYYTVMKICKVLSIEPNDIIHIE